MKNLYLMYSGDTVFYATENNGKLEIHANCIAKIGEWFIRFIENDTSEIPQTSILIRESPYDLLEYGFDKEALKERFKELLDCIFLQGISIKTLENEPVTKPSPIEMLKFTDIFKDEYKVKHSLVGNADGSFKIIRNYVVTNLSEALSVELILLLEHEKLLKKCENCDRYFFPKDSTEKYCDRPVDENRTCKDIGYINKVEKDTLLKLYSIAYKTKHAQKQRKTRNKSTATKEKYKNAIDEWRSDAKAYLKEAQKGMITIDKFKEILNKELEVE